ncbi:MAG: hypothetical protein GY791_14265 [Alphaproteobacteria bacterium]|nr:hypothetical protein [Alphaproteobacteria bacterium]
MDLTRRLVIRALAAAGALTPCAAMARLWPSDEARARDALVRLFTNPEAAAAIGRNCDGAPVAVTLRALACDLHLSLDGLARLEITALRRRLGDRIKSDFAHNMVVDVAGWRLSRTEARVYAVVAKRA